MRCVVTPCTEFGRPFLDDVKSFCSTLVVESGCSPLFGCLYLEHGDPLQQECPASSRGHCLHYSHLFLSPDSRALWVFRLVKGSNVTVSCTLTDCILGRADAVNAMNGASIGACNPPTSKNAFQKSVPLINKVHPQLPASPLIWGLSTTPNCAITINLTARIIIKSKFFCFMSSIYRISHPWTARIS